MPAIPVESVASLKYELDSFGNVVSGLETVPQEVKDDLQTTFTALESLEKSLRRWIDGECD